MPEAFAIRVTHECDAWLAGLRDKVGRSLILARVRRLGMSGHWGDAKPVGDGVVELRVSYGPGYRIYCKKIGRVVVLLLSGGDKSTQHRDITRAKDIAKQWQA